MTTPKITVANVKHFAMVSKNVAQVVAETTKVETAADYAGKINKLFDGKLEIVPNSVRECSMLETAKAVSFHVRPVVESRPFEDATQMRTVVEANVFSDEEDATWQVVEAAGIKRLVKRTDTDVGALLAAAAKQSINRIAASFFAADSSPVEQGEYALFTNPETASVDGGIVSYNDKGELQILARSTGDLVTASREAVIAHSHFDGIDEEHAYSKSNAKDMIQYFRTLFSSQPGFFAELEAMIKKGAVLA